MNANLKYASENSLLSHSKSDKMNKGKNEVIYELVIYNVFLSITVALQSRCQFEMRVDGF